MGTFRWFSNFYIVLVGPPGIVKKSTTINIGARMLREIPGIHVGADCTTWQAFVEEVGRAQDLFAEGDDLVGLGEEALLDQQHTVTSAVSLTISELGTFLRPNDIDMVNVLTELWDCKVDYAFRKSTKTQGDDVIMNPFVNIIAGTTPKWMNDNFKGQFGGWGFSSRCIFLHCGEPERFIAYPDEIWGKDNYEATSALFVNDLQEIAKLHGKVTISSGARDLGRFWYEGHMRRKSALDKHPHADPWLSYYLARKFDQAHKLAMILSVSRRDTLIIEESDLREALSRTDQVEEELASIFKSKESAGHEAEMNMSVWKRLAQHIAENGLLEQRRLFGFTMTFMTHGKAKDLIAHLVGAGWLVVESRPEGVFYSFGPNAARPEEAA